MIIGIDPGPEKSALVVYNQWGSGGVSYAAYSHNESVLNILAHRALRLKEEGICPTGGYLDMRCEMIDNNGMPVGKSTFETCVAIGRFLQAWGGTLEECAVYRRQVKLFLCNSMRAKDANVRQALIDKFPATGGGKTPQIGTKANPGPLYGLKSHMWSALAVAYTAAHRME